MLLFLQIWRVLQNCHEFHLRFASSRPYESIAPFSARVPPGLHISFTPLEGKKGYAENILNAYCKVDLR